MDIDQSETYRRILRISAAVVAAVLLFQSGTIDSRSTALFNETTAYLSASVGMSASVAPNELNVMTAELTEQRVLLAEREQALTEREIAIARNEPVESSDSEYVTYLLAALLFVQLVLIVLNYALDYLRSRERRSTMVQQA